MYFRLCRVLAVARETYHCSVQASLCWCRAGSTCPGCGACDAPRFNSCGAGMWDLSPRTRDQAHVLCTGRRMLNHWATRQVPEEVGFLSDVFYASNEMNVYGSLGVLYLLIFIDWCTILVLIWTKLVERNFHSRLSFLSVVSHLVLLDLMIPSLTIQLPTRNQALS